LPPRRRAEPSGFPSGVLNVDKAAGETSFTVVNRLRRLTGAHRVGHAGTLDPLATGVLPILFESATRLAEFALQLPKTYVADIHLGFTTATDDAEAEREAVSDPGLLTATEIATALKAFAGRIQQEPPAFSAVKVDGKRAYKLARRGEEPRPHAREVEVYEARLLGFTPGPEAVARVEIR
jgi:tRNA pseudouridine55 synthase